MRETNKKQNKNSLTCWVFFFFHKSNTFIETFSGFQTAQGQAVKRGAGGEKKEYFMILDGSQKSKMAPLNDD